MSRRTVSSILAAVAFAAAAAAGISPAVSATRSRPKLSVTAVDSEPEAGRKAPTDNELAALRKAVDDKPDDRQARFKLVRGLIAGRKLDDALAAARAWRERDAYNLVVVRLIGDIYSEMGDRERALRTYSAVVELLPEDPGAQRALASVLKQAGDIASARDRLDAAIKMREDDMRLRFELADASHRLGELDRARGELEAIVAAPDAPEAIKYPAKQRLAQILSEQRRGAAKRNDTDAATKLSAAIDALAINGGTENDIKIYLTWDTDRSDVDLWVTNPAGEKVFYSHKQGQSGDALYDDVTTGYGPESYTAPRARAGRYTVQVNYYNAGGGGFGEARGELVVVLNEGTADETRRVLPYRLYENGQVVTVAHIDVK